MSKLVIIGGSRGLGFTILKQIHSNYSFATIVDVLEPIEQFDNTSYVKFDLSKDNVFGLKELIINCDDLIITAGIGQVERFEDCSLAEIDKVFKVNTLSTIKILNLFYSNVLINRPAKCMVISSIAGEVSSPLMAVYGASKASISKICESLNIELEKSGNSNRITCITATAFQGTSFNGKPTDVDAVSDIAMECVNAMNNKETSHYVNKELCTDIINRYYSNRHEFGLSSYDYKIKSNRLSNDKKNIVVGYLSGTFDLFHIGHLNLLKRAKEQCDYLIVGIHESGSWKGKETFIPFEERLEIIRACKYVDEAYVSLDEDSDAWDLYHYDKLFVGSDYKGTERFKRYEDYFKDKGVEIVYFPYTQGTSSTQLRERLSKDNKK